MSTYYFKRPWEESRGDEYDSWGTSIYLFEAAPDGTVLKQLQIYEDGHTLKYDESHSEDIYGMLSAHELDLNEFANFSITQKDFEEAWQTSSATNQ
jgi:hypothetical protein